MSWYWYVDISWWCSVNICRVVIYFSTLNTRKWEAGIVLTGPSGWDHEYSRTSGALLLADGWRDVFDWTRAVRCNNKRSREGRSWLSQVSRTFSPRLSSGEAENYLNQIFRPFLPHINCWFFASASSCGDKKISAARNNKIKLHPELFFSPTGATRVGWHFWWQKRRILFSWFMRNILNRLYKVWNFICKFPTSR